MNPINFLPNFTDKDHAKIYLPKYDKVIVESENSEKSLKNKTKYKIRAASFDDIRVLPPILTFLQTLRIDTTSLHHQLIRSATLENFINDKTRLIFVIGGPLANPITKNILEELRIYTLKGLDL